MSATVMPARTVDKAAIGIAVEVEIDVLGIAGPGTPNSARNASWSRRASCSPTSAAISARCRGQSPGTAPCRRICARPDRCGSRRRSEPGSGSLSAALPGLHSKRGGIEMAAARIGDHAVFHAIELVAGRDDRLVEDRACFASVRALASLSAAMLFQVALIIWLAQCQAGAPATMPS